MEHSSRTIPQLAGGKREAEQDVGEEKIGVKIEEMRLEGASSV